MIYTEVLPKPEMRPRRPALVTWARRRALVILARRRALRSMSLLGLLAVSGCATINPVKAFHEYEGGTISQNPPPPPGLDRPAPNLAAVPPRPKAISPTLQRSIRAQLEAANHNQNSLAAPAGGVPAGKQAAPSPLVPRPPVLIAFIPGRAILSGTDRDTLRRLADRRGASPIAAIGFAPERTAAGLHLALRRATAIANALTRLGVPVASIRIEALALGRGGAAQLL